MFVELNGTFQHMSATTKILDSFPMFSRVLLHYFCPGPNSKHIYHIKLAPKA